MRQESVHRESQTESEEMVVDVRDLVSVTSVLVVGAVSLLIYWIW